MEKRIGHYEIISELGRGGMGVVLKAHEQSLNRYVALKVLGEHLSEDPSYVQRFLREARSAAALNHPNIVQIYSVDEFEGKHYFAMEFVSGKSVLQMIRSEGKIEPVESARLCLQAASGLAAAHEKNIIHRDIKPANLMVDERGLLKITDFGLALLGGGASRLTATGMFMGTPGYLSPEQCRDEEIDARTDIYSLGVTLFEMLTGSIPFKADSPLALLRQILEVEPPDVRDLNPEVPEGLRQILKKMMAKNRDERYASADLLAHDLQQWLESQGKSTVASALHLSTPATAAAAVPELEEMNSDPTMQMPSGDLREASFKPTEAMAPPTIPPAVPAPPMQPAAQATAQTSPAGEDRVAGFVAPAGAPAVAAPPPPVFTPASEPAPSGFAPTATSASAQKKSTMPLIILVAVLLLCALGAVAAWKTGAFAKLQQRFTGTKATVASTVPGAKGEAETSAAATSPEASSSEAEAQSPEAGAPSEGQGSAAPVASSAMSQASTGEGSAGGSSGTASGGPSSVTGGGGKPGPSATSGAIGSPPNATAGAGVSGGRSVSQKQQSLSGSAPSSSRTRNPSRAAAVQPHEPPPPPPVGHGVALVSVGEPLLEGSAVDYVHAALSKRGLEVFDAAGIPGVQRALESGGDLNPVLRPQARWLVMLSTETLGDRQLQFMGRWETEYQSRLILQVVDLERGAPIAPSIRKVLGYTRLNVEKKVPEALRVDFRPIAKLMGEIGN